MDPLSLEIAKNQQKSKKGLDFKERMEQLTNQGVKGSASGIVEHPTGLNPPAQPSKTNSTKNPPPPQSTIKGNKQDSKINQSNPQFNKDENKLENQSNQAPDDNHEHSSNSQGQQTPQLQNPESTPETNQTNPTDEKDPNADKNKMKRVIYQRVISTNQQYEHDELDLEQREQFGLIDKKKYKIPEWFSLSVTNGVVVSDDICAQLRKIWMRDNWLNQIGSITRNDLNYFVRILPKNLDADERARRILEADFNLSSNLLRVDKLPTSDILRQVDDLWVKFSILSTGGKTIQQFSNMIGDLANKLDIMSRITQSESEVLTTRILTTLNTFESTARNLQYSLSNFGASITESIRTVENAMDQYDREKHQEGTFSAPLSTVSGKTSNTPSNPKTPSMSTAHAPPIPKIGKRKN